MGQCCPLSLCVGCKCGKIGVIVVPMFSPNTSAAPSSRLIQPLAHIINVIAMVAAEACTIMVNIVPMSKNRIMEKNPISV